MRRCLTLLFLLSVVRLLVAPAGPSCTTHEAADVAAMAGMATADAHPDAHAGTHEGHGRHVTDAPADPDSRAPDTPVCCPAAMGCGPSAAILARAVSGATSDRLASLPPRSALHLAWFDTAPEPPPPRA